MPFFRDAKNAVDEMRNYAAESLQRSRDQTTHGPDDGKGTLLRKMQQAQQRQEVTFADVIEEAQTIILAGSDTTANTLVFTTWAVCQHPSWKLSLFEELRQLREDFDDRELRALKVLNQVVSEGLRLYASAPAALPRITPAVGAQLCGFAIPPGTTVSSQAFTLHRDERIFRDAHTFDPQRWENPSKEMLDALMPFGRGARSKLLKNVCRM